MGDGAGNVGQWKMALGPECQAEELDLDPEGLEKRTDRMEADNRKITLQSS